MTEKTYNIQKETPMMAGEPAVEYGVVDCVATDGLSSNDDWNPNVPFHGTQEEWWTHFRKIETGNFTPLEQANKEFEAWKKEYLARRLK